LISHFGLIDFVVFSPGKQGHLLGDKAEEISHYLVFVGSGLDKYLCHPGGLDDELNRSIDLTGMLRLRNRQIVNGADLLTQLLSLLCAQHRLPLLAFVPQRSHN
jgi:hypothetical protein